VADRSDDDVEINLGRYARMVLRRWWIVLAAVVVAVIVAEVGAGGSTTTYQGRALLFMGQPYTANGVPITAALGANPATPGLLIHQPAVLQKAAAAAGLRPGQLSGHVSAQVVSSSITKTSFTPLVNIIVQGPWRDKVAPAANSFAQQVVALTSTYQGSRSQILSTLVKREQAEQAGLNAREKALLQSLNAVNHDKSLTPLNRIIAGGPIQGAITNIGTRLGQLEDTLSSNQQLLAQVKGVEDGQVVTPAVSSSSSAAGGGAHLSIAVILGLVAGVILALLSYAVWPESRSSVPREKAAT
jgi:uncharacterized protein involved in exopolysaccharide biosynthesis